MVTYLGRYLGYSVLCTLYLHFALIIFTTLQKGQTGKKGENRLHRQVATYLVNFPVGDMFGVIR
jgi:hypothetical protein